MKKQLVSFLLFFIIGATAFAQQAENNRYSDGEGVVQKFPRNEIRINLLTSVLAIPEFNYEYFVEDNFGIGAAIQMSLEEYQNMPYRFGFIPYGRLYFGELLNAGFFIEGSMGVIYEKFDNYQYSSVPPSQRGVIDEINFGVGVAIGYKFLTKNDWVGDISLGAGRIFGNTRFEAYPRAGISIGKRF